MRKPIIRRLLALLTLIALVGACGGDDDGESTASTDTDNGTETTVGSDETDPEPSSGGTLRVGWASPTSGMDPHKPVHSGESNHHFLVYDRLTQLSDEYVVEPMLAESWEFVDGGTALELYLREGVTFQDGSPLNAEAVQMSLQRAMELEGSTVAARMTSIREIEVVDDLTVRILLEPGSGAELPAVLATAAGVVISAEALEEGRDLMTDSADAGSGPYEIEDFQPNESATFVPRPDGHWDDRAGLLDRLEVLAIPATPARMNGILSGDLDVAQISPPETSEALDHIEDGRFNGRHVHTLTVYAAFMNAAVPPFDDQNVRLAMNHAIDRDAIQQDLFGGHCLATAQPLPPDSPYANPAVDDALTFDLERASELVTAAGSFDAFEMVYIPNTAFESMATATSAWFDQVGLTSQITPKPSAENLAGYRTGDHHGLYNAIIAQPHPALTIENFYLGGVGLVPANAPERAQLEDLAAQGKDPALDEDEHAAAYQEFWGIVAEAGYGAPICFSDMVWAYGDAVAGMDETRGLWMSAPDLRYLTRTD